MRERQSTCERPVEEDARRANGGIDLEKNADPHVPAVRIAERLPHALAAHAVVVVRNGAVRGKQMSNAALYPGLHSTVRAILSWAI